MGDVGVVVRELSEEDVGAAVGVLGRVHAVDGYPVDGGNINAGWLRHAGTVTAWVAEADGAVVAHASLVARPYGRAAGLWEAEHPQDLGRTVSLARLFVDPGARGRALGAALVRGAQEHARAVGLRLVLDVMLKDAAAIRLYERLGWREFARTTFFLAGRDMPAACFVAPGTAPGPAAGVSAP